MMAHKPDRMRQLYWAANRAWRRLQWHLFRPDHLLCATTGRTMFLSRPDKRGLALWCEGGNVNPKALTLWQHLLDARSWQLVLDVGCNHGEMLLAARLPAQAKLLAFEPNPHLVALLRRSFRANGLDVTLFETAVGAQPGMAMLSIDPAWSGGSHLSQSGTPVQMVTLADTLAGFDDGLTLVVKIDVEGHEPAVLEGLRPALARWSELAVLLEIMHLSPETRAGLAQEFDVLIGDPHGQWRAVAMADLAPDQLDVVLVRKGEAGRLLG